MFETIRSVLILIWSLAVNMPIATLAILGVILAISAFFAGLMCVFENRSKKKNAQKVDEKQIEKKALNKIKNEEVITPAFENKPITSNEVVKLDPDVKEMVTTKDDVEKNEKALPFILEDNEKTEPEFDIINFIIENYNYKNVELSKGSIVDEMEINQKGVFLIFKDNNLKGDVKGERFDEFLHVKKRKIPNPVFQKHAYRSVVNKWLKTDEKIIETLFIAPKIKESIPSIGIFKSEDSLKSYLQGKPNLLTIDNVFTLSERVDFLDKRRK